MWSRPRYLLWPFFCPASGLCSQQVLQFYRHNVWNMLQHLSETAQYKPTAAVRSISPQGDVAWKPLKRFVVFILIHSLWDTLSLSPFSFEVTGNKSILDDRHIQQLLPDVC